METWLFYIFGGTALLAAVNVVVARRVFYSAVSLIICLSALAGIYMLLDAPFIAAVQIIVYAGAIMVLFLFVIMLLDPFSATPPGGKKRFLGYLSVLLGTLVLVLLYPVLSAYDVSRAPRDPLAGAGTMKVIGQTLFNEYLLPFEVTSILILVAIIGAVVLAKRMA